MSRITKGKRGVSGRAIVALGRWIFGSLALGFAYLCYVYLTLPDVPLRVSGPDQLETDAFYRYNQTLQRFFDGAAWVETSFPPTRDRRAA